MTFSLIATAVVSLAFAQASTSAPTTPTVQEPQAQTAQARHASETLPATDPDDKIICRRVRSVGSNLTTRDCRTVGQRRKEAEEAKASLRDNKGIDNLDLGAR